MQVYSPFLSITICKCILCTCIMILLKFILVGVLITSVKSDNAADEDLIITKSQKDALDKFKSRVLPILPRNYMKEDVYLIRWLRAKDFKIDEAERFLKADLKWRKSTKIETLRLEDFSDISSDYPVYVDTYDKNGAPVITAIAGQWNLRTVHLSGLADRAQLFLDKVMDGAAAQVRRVQTEGKNVTRFLFLLNLEGFNLVEHGCPRCFLGIVTFLQSYESHFPGLTDKIVIFNAPPTVQAVRPIVRQAISTHTRRHIKIFGSNKVEWRRYLLDFIDEDQLTEDFGGTRIRYSEL
ncbi:unnamed protein product [Orchesella dallaii]|uniref:CRAL-TRIO domain-containing protein n=1 Tax=Orchesella dallaii TaxID=48710 RepID=A0ABP1PJG2_9HEXA